MKHLFIMLMLMGITAQAISQNNKLPEKFYGEWFQKDGHREYNGLLIRPDFIEFFYQACRYGKIEHRDSAYSVDAILPKGDTVSFTIRSITDDTIKVIRPGGDIAVYGRVDCPLNGIRIEPDDLPKNFRKKWYSTDGKNSVEFDLTGNKFLFRGEEYNVEDVILFKERFGMQYRIIAENDKGNVMMFYFKNWNDGYCQVGFFGKNGNFYRFYYQFCG